MGVLRHSANVSFGMVMPRCEAVMSAEHGIGIIKLDTLARRADPVKMALLRRVKAAGPERGDEPVGFGLGGTVR